MLKVSYRFSDGRFILRGVNSSHTSELLRQSGQRSTASQLPGAGAGTCSFDDLQNEQYQ
jgi:hypothetical protein